MIDSIKLAELPCIASVSVLREFVRIVNASFVRIVWIVHVLPFFFPKKNVQTMDDHKRKACSRLSIRRDEDTVLENSPTFSI